MCRDRMSAANQPSVLQRYAAGYWIYFRHLRRTQWKSPEELHADQLKRLRRLVRAAYERVPYYRSLFEKLGATPDDFRELADLAKVPVLHKQTVRERFNDFINPDHDPRRVFEDHTSGSTGQPLRFLLTHEQKAYEMAYSIRFWRWAGYRTGARIAAFRSYIPASETDPLWKYDRRQRTLFFSVYNMQPVNLRNYAEQFNRFRPEFVRGYPSSIYIFAQFVVAEGLKVRAPRAVLSSSETLSPEMKAVIERALQCPVFDWWGSNERIAIACQCERREFYHISAEGSYLEFLPEQGGMYRIIGTGLINHAMPLIRYDLGDLALPAKTPCPCGRGLPGIARILGRVNDLIVTGDQKYVPSVRFYTLFETYEQIRQFQVVQTAPNFVTVRLVRARELNDAELNGVRQKLNRFLGDRVVIEFEFVEEIKPEPSGKIRNVISMVKR
jgi:phenylacetate-CoA ligase